MAAAHRSTTPRTPFNPIHFVVRNIVTLFIGGYGISITGFLVMRWLVGESWDIIALFNNVLHLLLVPALILLPAALLLRRWWLALTVIMPVALFVSSYGGQFLPQQVAHANDDQKISLLTFNVLGSWRRTPPVVDTIRDTDADIVLLQELSPMLARDLEQSLSAEYPYQALHPARGYAGQGILSRYPIIDDRYWTRSLGNQRAQILVKGEVVTIYNAHPVHPFRSKDELFDPVSRTQDISEILDMAAQETTPVILAGDFNMTDQTEDYSRVTDSYSDTFREVGWGMGLTFPAKDVHFFLFEVPFRVARLDYVFHNEQFRAISAHVWPASGGSDHSPLYAELALVNTE